MRWEAHIGKEKNNDSLRGWQETGLTMAYMKFYFSDSLSCCGCGSVGTCVRGYVGTWVRGSVGT